MLRLLVTILVGICFQVPLQSDATPPPFELAQKSIAQHRVDESVTLDLRVTQMSGALREFELRGTFKYGAPVAALASDAFELRLLWISLVATDPIAELQRKATFVDDKKATVGVQEGFVYVYGSTPSASVYRDLKRLAALSTMRDGHTWVVRLTWREDTLTGVMITRNGSTVLTARAKDSTPPKPPKR